MRYNFFNLSLSKMLTASACLGFFFNSLPAISMDYPFEESTTQALQRNKFPFYDRDKPGFELTNFFESPFWNNGAYYKTSEHYFQAQKFSAHPTIMKEIIHSATPRDAFDIAQKYKTYIDPAWHNGRKQEVMKDALKSKFTHHTKLWAFLLASDGIGLFECSPIDSEWGTGTKTIPGPGENSGKNLLGQFLQETRESIFNGTYPFHGGAYSNRQAELSQPTLHLLHKIGRYEYWLYLLNNPPIRYNNYREWYGYNKASQPAHVRHPAASGGYNSYGPLAYGMFPTDSWGASYGQPRQQGGYGYHPSQPNPNLPPAPY